jgi:hydroxymethylglutaryl-CoA reductase (NADPH)
MSDTQKSRPKPGRFQASEESRKRRVETLKAKTGDPLLSLSFSGVDATSTVGNLENYIGTIQIPMGLAGPLTFNFKTGSEKISTPIATTEAALVSSITRGAIAISTSGGVTTRLLSNRMSRAPVFQFKSLDESLEFTKWIKIQFSKLSTLVEKKSRFAKLVEIDPKVFGKSAQVRFIYTTGNAAGQNMTTFCTSILCDWIIKKIPQDLGFECLDFFIEGNLSSDKKVSQLSAIDGRGRSVIAEATIKASVLKRVLKTTAPKLVQQFNLSKSNRLYSGMLGFNINIANVIAGIFLATGQDMACVHECSIGELHLEVVGDDLYAALSLPCLIVGTVGGGTHLPGPRDSLKILDCTGENSADRLSEIIAGFTLALELSTVSAISGGQFVDAHEKSARTTTLHWLKLSDIGVDFFNKYILKKSEEIVKDIRPLHELEAEHGHVTDLAFQVSKKFSGLLAYEVSTEDSKKGLHEKMQVFLKVKPRDYEVVQGAARILSVIDPMAAQQLVHLGKNLPFKNCHKRELQAALLLKNHNLFLGPQFLGSFQDSQTETYILIQEFLSSDYLISPVNQPQVWTQKNRELVYTAISQLHLKFNESSKAALLREVPDLYEVSDSERRELLPLWTKLKDISFHLLGPELLSPLNEEWEKSLQIYPHHSVKLRELPLGLIHNDFNSRNMALLLNQSVKFFDWEFLAWGLPQRDLVEFLIFALETDSFEDNFKLDTRKYFEKYFSHIYKEKGLTEADWQEGLRIAYQDFLVSRLPFYVIISQFSKCEYLERVINNLQKLGSI